MRISKGSPAADWMAGWRSYTSEDIASLLYRRCQLLNWCDTKIQFTSEVEFSYGINLIDCFHIRAVHLDIIKVLFIHQLMH